MALLVCAAAAHAQGPDPTELIRAAMEASLAKQHEALERQRAALRAQFRGAAPADAFFTVPWAAALAAAGLPARRADCEIIPPEQIAPLVEDIARREGLTPNLLRAVIEQESAYLPCAVSSKGAQGLMQLMPETAADLGVHDPFDPTQNLGGGARFLRQLLDRYGGDLALALGAYNAGPRHVDRTGRLPLFPETVSYVSEILEKLGGRPAAQTQR
jgi:soluble lytic murein transglycosylase-like protein